MKRLVIAAVFGALVMFVLMLAVVLVMTGGPRAEAIPVSFAQPSLQLERGYASEAMEDAAPPPPSPGRAKMAAKKDRAHGSGVEGGVVGGVIGGTIGSAGIGGLGEVLPFSEGEPAGDRRAAPPVAKRAWFPETFLFEPLVVTDAEGRATVPVKVPDRLTTWRVLALAHSRGGEQAGTVATFLGTLPTYVDPNVPPFLIAGDKVRIPVQVVNTTEREVSGGLVVKASGATLGSPGSTTVHVAPAGTTVSQISLTAARPGTAVLEAAYGGHDAVSRQIPILPAGRPELEVNGGTLAQARTVTSNEPAPGADPLNVRLSVFPGALALVRSELSASLWRASVADDAYALLLAGRAPALLRSLGDEADQEALRKSILILQQRALRHGRAPDVATSALLAEAALAHPESALLSRLGERLADTVARGQRPDGTCLGGEGSTLQRMLVATAECVRAVKASESTAGGKQRAAGVAIRAAGAFERYAADVKDGYTAAAILASGALSGAVAERLRERVVSSIEEAPDGSKYLRVDEGVVRADGFVPSRAEATAQAILALQADSKAPLAELGSYLLGQYDPMIGWGDGRANLAGLNAALTLFKDPLPSQVQVALELDGKVIAEGVLSPDKQKDVLTLDAAIDAPAQGPHTWTVRADPAVPGLGFRFARQRWVPWTAEPPMHGLELKVKAPTQLAVGRAGEVELTGAGPAGHAFELRSGLPAGVQPDRPGLEALKERGVITAFRVEDGAVVFTLPPKRAGETFSFAYRVIPTLAGTLSSPATKLQLVGSPEVAFHVPPEVWTIR